MSNKNIEYMREWSETEEGQTQIMECVKKLIQSKEGTMSDKIIQVSGFGFGVANTQTTQCHYMLVALTENGRVLMSRGDGEWSDVTEKKGGNDDKK